MLLHESKPCGVSPRVGPFLVGRPVKGMVKSISSSPTRSRQVVYRAESGQDMGQSVIRVVVDRSLVPPEQNVLVAEGEFAGDGVKVVVRSTSAEHEVEVFGDDGTGEWWWGYRIRLTQTWKNEEGMPPEIGVMVDWRTDMPAGDGVSMVSPVLVEGEVRVDSDVLSLAKSVSFLFDVTSDRPNLKGDGIRGVVSVEDPE